MSLNVVPWPGEWTWERGLDIHTATVQKKWLIFQGNVFFKSRIYMSFYVCTLIGEKPTKTKFHRICEEEAGEKEYRDGPNDPNQSRKYTLCL